MKLNIGTVSNLIKHGDVILELLGGNTTQTAENLRDISTDPVRLRRLMNALEGLNQNLRVVKLVDVNVE